MIFRLSLYVLATTKELIIDPRREVNVRGDFSMGLRYRKSINLGGGFKINLSKSGVGYSWGTKGYRITKTARGSTRRTYSIPGTGLSYVDESGKRNKAQTRNSSNSFNQPASRPEYQPMYGQPQTQERAIISADISQFKEAEVGNISSAIEKTILLNKIGVILLAGFFFVMLNPLFLLLPLAGIIMIIIAHTAGRVSLDYCFDAEKNDEHTRRIDAWRLLTDGQKEWQTITTQQNSNQKVHAGAARSIKRVNCKVKKGHPYYIKTNVDTIQIMLHNHERLIILPDKVFFIRKDKVGLIDYADFQIVTTSQRFVENDPVPKDATVVDYTWQYVNKDGSPDKRFNNNRQLPVCLYGKVLLRSASGLDVELQISSIQNTKDFAELIQ